MVSRDEIDRRYGLIRDAMAEEQLDAVLVCGSEYTGFEGAVTYMSGFVIVHRYAYVVLPKEGEPTIVFPSEARYVGQHGDGWIEEQVFVDRPGQYIGDRWKAHRVGVYGMDYVMAVRDFEVAGLQVDFLPFDVEFDLARAVKSEEELESVRDSVRINTEGFWTFLEAYAPGKSAAEVLAPAEELFVPACFACMHTLTLLASRMAIVENGRAFSRKPNTFP
jgi:Xaa-Pro aminopeptidase